MKILLIALAILFSGSAGYAQEDTQSTQTTETKVEVEKTDRNNNNIGGAYIEPYLTYEIDDVKTKTSQLPLVNNDTTGTSQGFGLGARLGVHVQEVVFVAADARYAQPQMDKSLYSNTKADQYNYGATLGVQTPLAGLRLWGTYVIGGRMNPDSGANGVDLRFDDLKGYRVGAGLYIKSLSVNLEYQKLAYDTTHVQSWGDVAVDTSFGTDTDIEGYLLSLGFPFTL